VVIDDRGAARFRRLPRRALDENAVVDRLGDDVAVGRVVAADENAGDAGADRYAVAGWLQVEAAGGAADAVTGDVVPGVAVQPHRSVAEAAEAEAMHIEYGISRRAAGDDEAVLDRMRRAVQHDADYGIVADVERVLGGSVLLLRVDDDRRRDRGKLLHE